MILQELKLENFRNLEDLNLKFDSGKKVTVFIGENAQGKTNVLESIYFLALTKSFRTKNFTDLIKWERQHGRIQGLVESDGRSEELEVAFTSEPTRAKKFKKSGVVLESKKYIQSLKVVIFVPEDVHIITGDPATRRRYLNLLCMQTFPGFLSTIVTYTRALKNRNELLKKRAPQSHIEIWDMKLAELGTEIYKWRAQILAEFQNRINQKYESLSESPKTVKINYKPGPLEYADYLDQMSARIESDRITQTTTFGPHRDNFEVLIDGQPMKKYGSRGECRTAVLAMKLVELELIRELTGEKPVLLLDDVLSELDHSRQKHLIEIILEHQSFVTTTCLEHLEGFVEDISVLTVANGQINSLK